MALLLKNARLVDPQVGLDEVAEVLIRDGVVVEVGHNLEMPKGVVRDLSGKVLIPGMVDMHVHLRDPGFEYKEAIATGTRSAAHGGFTGICSMPNTDPCTDDAVSVTYVVAKAEEIGKCRVYPSGACSQGLKGETLAEMGCMVEAGAVAFTDDGRGIQDAGMMRRVMDYASQFNKPVMSHCQDESLVGDGQINEGPVSTKLGLLGWPAAGEELQIARDIALCRITGCPLHIQHISTERGLNLVREAKAEGLPVTCEVTPHHLFLCDEDIDDSYDTNFKVNPPLRRPSDRDALVEGLLDGSIDCVVTDHAPHADFEKDREFECAPFGMIGLETSLPAVLTHLVHPGKLSWNRLVEVMSVNPRSILRLPRVAIEAGSVADFTVIDPETPWEVTKKSLISRSKNCAFLGETLIGRATDTYVAGYATMEDGEIVE